MDDYRQNIADGLSDEAVDFFATFSRFEFALKRGGFALGELGGTANPDWHRFANALGDRFYRRMHRAPQAEIFFRAPPRVLKMLAADHVEFGDAPRVVNGQTLFDAVKVVRNNLFHGEKVLMQPRDEQLIAASLFVLDSAMDACWENEATRQVPRAFIFAQVAPH